MTTVRTHKHEEYVNNSSPTAYPPAVPDGYEYLPLGQLGAQAKIATGEYTGTGTYGVDNPCTLYFDFKPLLVLVYYPDDLGYITGVKSSYYGESNLIIAPYLSKEARRMTRYSLAYGSVEQATDHYEFTDSGFTWWVTWSTSVNREDGHDGFGQLNYSGRKYRYVVIGV